MDRISLLLKKIETLNEKQEKSALDIDLMMDYLRVIYADLLETKASLPDKIITAANQQDEEKTTQPKFSLPEEPTLEEVTQALEKDTTNDDDEKENKPEELTENIDKSSENTESEPAEEDENKETDTQDKVNLLHQYSSNNFQFSEKPQPISLSKNDIQEFSFPQKNKEDIRKFVGINEKFVFINELFDGKRDAYEEVLDELNEFSSTKEALRWLKNSIMQPYNWTEDDFNVQDFLRVLESFYNRVTS